MIDARTLKTRIDLALWLSRNGLTLKTRGANAFALCPFHHEDTPSFTVNPKTQLWHCFGCGAGGDIFTFLQKRDGLTFSQALRRLAREIDPTRATSGSRP